MASGRSGNLWFGLGIGLILLGGAAYMLLAMAGLGFAFGKASVETGVPIWLVMLVPGIVVLGFLVLLLKVIVDRIGNAEDDHYSNTVDK